MKSGLLKTYLMAASAALAITLLPQALPAGDAPNPEGTYETNFGALTLKLNGNKVSGTYPHDAGRIEGTWEGSRMVGRWSEAPTYKPPHDAGDFVFAFPKDFKSFAGKWRYGFGGKEWSGDWHGTRTASALEEMVSGDWNTSFGKLSLKQTANKITGAYTNQNGRIDGMLQGNIIKGTWSQAPSYKPPKDAGDFMFVLSADRDSFSGKYRQGFGGEQWTGNWTGTKASSAGYALVEGEYLTTYGKTNFKLTLKQSGNKITGIYEHDNGRLEGTIEGSEIRGRWYEAPTYKPPKDAGEFRFSFAQDLKSFTGKWHYGFEEKQWRSDWNGKKIP